ncbi:MAG: hypothetical protein CME71_07505 [Halobacteriovorax sp.]|nr:hypothetical protein [Halobacteriovorax sp.]
MPINCGFILAAGKGSRMGPIGNELPKVLWPVFESTLVGLQINFLKQFGVSKIWVNTHHQADLVKNYLAREHPDAKILFEPTLLDSGGGIHNFILESQVKDSFLVINSDQYLKLDEATKQRMKESDSTKPSLLCAMPGAAPYSSLRVVDNKLVSISKEPGGPMFTGLSRINPTGIIAKKQPSKFFETVCDYKNTNIEVVECDGEFLDFGSPLLYRNSMKKLLHKLLSDEQLLNEWQEAGLIDPQKINPKLLSYGCDQAEVFNFSGENLEQHWPKGSIILKQDATQTQSAAPCIVYGKVVEVF